MAPGRVRRGRHGERGQGLAERAGGGRRERDPRQPGAARARWGRRRGGREPGAARNGGRREWRRGASRRSTPRRGWGRGRREGRHAEQGLVGVRRRWEGDARRARRQVLGSVARMQPVEDVEVRSALLAHARSLLGAPRRVVRALAGKGVGRELASLDASPDAARALPQAHRSAPNSEAPAYPSPSALASAFRRARRGTTISPAGCATRCPEGLRGVAWSLRVLAVLTGPPAPPDLARGLLPRGRPGSGPSSSGTGPALLAGETTLGA